MARPLSDEELQLRKRARRRLIGAIALVTAVAVVLPMVLDSEPRPVSQDVNIKIPATDSGGFTSKVTPAPQLKPAPQLQTAPAPAIESSGTTAAPTEPAAAAAKHEAVASTEKTPAAKPAAPAEPPAPAVKSTAKTVAAKEPAAKTAKAPNGHFVVQVAALSDAEKAKQMRQQISAAGIKSYTEVVKTVKGDVTRVRAGPFATREAAEKVQKQLKAIGLDGKVVPK
jgi:DedD protein